MAKQSIVFNDMSSCIVCGSPYVEVHHICYGVSNRKWSDKYGLIAPLCAEHHRGTKLSPHSNKEFDWQLKQLAQRRFQEVYPELDFRAIFGMNYL